MLICFYWILHISAFGSSSCILNHKVFWGRNNFNIYIQWKNKVSFFKVKTEFIKTKFLFLLWVFSTLTFLSEIRVFVFYILCPLWGIISFLYDWKLLIELLLRQTILWFVVLHDVHKRPKRVAYNRLSKHVDKSYDWQQVLSLYF